MISAYMLFGDVEKWVKNNLQSETSLTVYTMLSFIILTSDIILPVPSSLVMILNGKVLGVISGTIVSLTSGVISSSIGFYLGRKSNPFINKLFNKNDQQISHDLIKNFGNITITISKALPIISEAVSIVSGTTLLSFKTFFVYSVAGHLIVSVIYAFVGNFTTSLHSNIITAIIIVSALMIAWIMQMAIRSKSLQDNK